MVSIGKDAYKFCKTCEGCQITNSITHHDQMPLTSILVREIFYITPR